jgi:hypothetical protein
MTEAERFGVESSLFPFRISGFGIRVSGFDFDLGV